MAKRYFLPRSAGERRHWLANFAAKLPIHAPIVAVTAAEIDAAQADSLFFGFVCDAQYQFFQTAQTWTAYKKALNGGGALSNLPTAPVFGAPPPAVPANIFGRIIRLVARIKNHPGYTEAMGEDLGIIGPERTVDFNTLKPILKLTLQAGRPNIGWTKHGMDGLEIHVDRGAGDFAFLTIDTMPDYPDTAPLPTPGASAVWKYKAIYRLADKPVGQWSAVASISVMG